MTDAGIPQGPGLYVHVPFCLSRCRYCAFASQALDQAEPGPAAYLQGIELELQRLPQAFAAETIFIGGGTPTALPELLLARLLSAAGWRSETGSRLLGRVGTETGRRSEARGLPRQGRGRRPEWTCEANPETVTTSKAHLLREAGVNRVSLGAQSFDDGVLERLGRAHTARRIHEAWGALRAAGFDNLNLDLLLGLPDRSRDDLMRDLRQALSLCPEHISCYALEIEAGTPLFREREQGHFAELDGGEAAERYHLVRRVLAEAGYEHYEISNWALPGRACRHNLLYWTGGDYEGCGPSAHSHAQGLRRGNLRDTKTWLAAIRAGRPATAFAERLDAEARARETLVMGLRLVAGIDCEAFRRSTGYDVFNLGGHKLRQRLDEGWLTMEGGRLRLAEHALFVSNTILADLV